MRTHPKTVARQCNIGCKAATSPSCVAERGVIFFMRRNIELVFRTNSKFGNGELAMAGGAVLSIQSLDDKCFADARELTSACLVVHIGISLP